MFLVTRGAQAVGEEPVAVAQSPAIGLGRVIVNEYPRLRCKLIDLGKWFSEEHAISDPLRPEHLEKFADLPPGEQLDGRE